LIISKHPPYAHTPLHLLADFLRRGRCDGQHTRKTFKIKHPPCPLQRGRCDGQHTRAL